jgi:hypothetical protein
MIYLHHFDVKKSLDLIIKIKRKNLGKKYNYKIVFCE